MNENLNFNKEHENKLDRCPYCGDTTIKTLGDISKNVDEIHKLQLCKSCNQKWIEVFKFSERAYYFAHNYNEKINNITL